jgi:Uma2 family endonuclease
VSATPIHPVPLRAALAGFRRFSVDEYHRLTQVGVLTEDDDVELLEGYVVHKMARNPPHDGAIDLTHHALSKLLPPGWMLRIQEAITLADSEPEPDLAVVRGTPRSFLQHHPTAADVGLVIEVADSSLDSDRTDKARIYARAGIPLYWIINLVDGQIEVCSHPSGQTTDPDYGDREVLRPPAAVAFPLAQPPAAPVPAAELLP